MEALKIETHYRNTGTDTMKVTGFTEEELSELNSMDYREMQEKVLEMLDTRNGNLGDCWKNGYGVYGMWIMNGAVYVEIGNTCD